MLNKKQLLLLTISCLLHLLHMIIFSQILKQIYVKISNTQNAERIVLWTHMCPYPASTIIILPTFIFPIPFFYGLY